jgi:multidrug efflux pump subunit AcrB
VRVYPALGEPLLVRVRRLDVFSKRLEEELKLLQRVGKVTRSGVRAEAIYVETDLGAWSQLDLTAEELEQLVARRNIVAPGGSIDTGVGRFSVDPTGDLDLVRELGSIVVGSSKSGEAEVPVYLEDVGLRVVRGYEDPPSEIARYADPLARGPAVIVAFSMKSGASIVDVCTAAKELVGRLKDVDRLLPPDPILGLTVREFRECLVRAGEVRLLPIAMTTLTTIGGLLPLALAGGPLWEGMAWLMIFGLSVATLLTLIVVPALYAILLRT